MTLNFTSCYTQFPTSIHSDDDFGSTIWERGAENCGNPCWLNWEYSDTCENGGRRDWADPVDLLPADPFGMELRSNLAAAFFGWLEDLGANPSDCTGLCWDSIPECAFDCWVDEGLPELSSYVVQDGIFVQTAAVDEKETVDSREPQQGPPHEGLILSLGLLGVRDLLSAESVCKSFRDAVQGDPLLWRCIDVHPPLNKNITDDALLGLTRRAQGSLRCLSLVNCSRITDDGLRQVLESNPRLEKLDISECLRLSTEGLINSLKVLKSSGGMRIKHLRLGRLFSVSPEQYEELQLLLGVDDLRQQNFYKPRLYHFYNSGGSSTAYDDDDDDRMIDIEMCPRCQKFKLVFDCSSESCRGKGPEHCRACHFCIGRCKGCGRCVNDCSFEETFFLDFLCSDCQENPEEE